MADREKDKPENRGMGAAWRQSTAGAREYGGDFLRTLRQDRLDSALLIVAPIFAVPIVGACALLSGGTVERHYEPDTATVAGRLDAAQGYVAISENDGKDGIALFHNGTEYRLYSFTTEGNGDRLLTYIGDREDAWQSIRQMTSKLAHTAEAAQNPDSTVEPSHIEFFRFTDLSPPIEKDQQIIRVGKGIEEIVPEGAIAAALTPQLAAWRAASGAVAEGHYGFGGQAVADAHYSETQIKDYSLAKIFMYAFGGLTALGLTGVATSAAGTTRRRRKYAAKRG